MRLFLCVLCFLVAAAPALGETEQADSPPATSAEAADSTAVDGTCRETIGAESDGAGNADPETWEDFTVPVDGTPEDP